MTGYGVPFEVSTLYGLFYGGIVAAIKILKRFIPAFIKDWYKFVMAKTDTESTKKIFCEVKEKNIWGSSESVSGPGSDLSQTQTLVIELPRLLKEKNIKTLLDIPCGDFNWMKNIDMSGISYIGADIVNELIEENTEKYETENIKFSVMDIVNDRLPKSDMVFVRDCFVHLPYRHILKAMKNIKKSGSKYLLATTFTEVSKNYDIIMENLIGRWRPLNLRLKPFMFPEPEYIIVENCTEMDGRRKDKSVGLWDITKL